MNNNLSIVERLNNLCEEVIADTDQTAATIALSVDAVAKELTPFATLLSKNYYEVLKKYQSISGNSSMYLPIYSRELASGASERLSIYISTDIGLTKNKDGSFTNVQFVNAHVIWHRYEDINLLSVRGNNMDPDGEVRFSNPKVADFLNKLSMAVSYVKSDKFNQDFVNTVADACKNTLQRNAGLKATATLCNTI